MRPQGRPSTSDDNLADRVSAASGRAIRWEQCGALAHIILDRPGKLNAINKDVLAGIRAAVDVAEAEGSVRALIVRGEGRAFSAGGDLDEVASLVTRPDEFNRFLDEWHETLFRIYDSPVPSVAAVHGFAFAGGFELTQVCDVVVIGDTTRIADQHANFGLFPAGGSTQRVPRLAGPRLASWLLLSGEPISPERAVSAGLATEVVKEVDVLTRATAMAETLAVRSPAATAAIKRAMRSGQGLNIRDAIAAERDGAVRHMASGDVQIGLEAFRRRLKPDFPDSPSPISSSET